MVTLTVFINGEAAAFAWALFSLLSINSKVLFSVCVCAKDRRNSVIERELKKTGKYERKYRRQKGKKTAILITLR
jgi:hypothetical protein